MRYRYQGPRVSSGFGMLPPTPPAVKKLLLANAIAWFCFAMALALGFRPLLALFHWLSLTPAAFLSGAIWQPVTYLFLHDPGGFWHLGMNLFALWMFGSVLVGEWGGRRFLNFYFACGIGAGLIDVAVRTLTGAGSVATVGASGAVLAVVTAFAVKFPRVPILISFIFPVPAWVVAAAYAAINLLGAVGDLSGGGNPSGTAFTIHLAGMALGYYFVRRQAGLPRLPSLNLSAEYRQWQLRRSRRKFEAYMKRRDRGGGPWVH